MRWRPPPTRWPTSSGSRRLPDPVQPAQPGRDDPRLDRGDRGHRPAVDLVEAFDPASIPTKERRARYLIDVARGYAQSDRDEAALRVLVEADKLARRTRWSAR